MARYMVRKGLFATVAVLICIASVAGVYSSVQFGEKSTDMPLHTVASTAPTITPSPTPQVFADPTVTATRWHTDQPVITPPTNRLDDIAPVIQIASPENQTTTHTAGLTLTVNVASYFWILDSITCKTDWQPGTQKLFGIQPSYVDALNATITATFPQVPQGTHTITIYADTHDSMHTEAKLTFTKTE
jgi:hypothetical protein